MSFPPCAPPLAWQFGRSARAVVRQSAAYCESGELACAWVSESMGKARAAAIQKLARNSRQRDRCSFRAPLFSPCAATTICLPCLCLSHQLLSLVLVSFRHNQVRSENVCWSLCVAAPAGRPSLRSPGSCIVQPSRALGTLPGFCAHCLSALTGALTVTSSDYEAYSPRLLQRRASRSHLITPWFASPATAITDHFVQA